MAAGLDGGGMVVANANANAMSAYIVQTLKSASEQQYSSIRIIRDAGECVAVCVVEIGSLMESFGSSDIIHDHKIGP